MWAQIEMCTEESQLSARIGKVRQSREPEPGEDEILLKESVSWTSWKLFASWHTVGVKHVELDVKEARQTSS